MKTNEAVGCFLFLILILSFFLSGIVWSLFGDSLFFFDSFWKLFGIVASLLLVVLVVVGVICLISELLYHPKSAKKIKQSLGLLPLLALAFGIGWWLYGQWMLSDGKYAQAAETRQAKIETAKRLTREGFSLLEEGNIDAARVTFLTVLENDEDNSSAWNGYGDSLWRNYQRRRDLNELREAIKACGKSLKLNPNQAETHLKLASRLVCRTTLWEENKFSSPPLGRIRYLSEAKKHCWEVLKLVPRGRLAQEASQLLDQIYRKENK